MGDAELQERLAGIEPSDIVIGVPSYNHARTIPPVLEAVRRGLAKHFAGTRAALIVSDAGSTDGTPELVADAEWEGARLVVQHESPPGERVNVPFHGIPGRAAAQRALLMAADRLGARACALIAADCRSLTPEWTDRLLRPVLEDAGDLVSPLYQRHRYDGTLTTSLIAPLIRALYGRRLRQPMGGHVALSGRLVAHLGAQEVWRTEPARQGVDLWLTVTAILGGFRVLEAWLGPCLVDGHGRPADLATVFAQAVGPTLALLETTADAWAEVRGSAPVPAIGTPLPPGTEPVEIEVPRMVRGFKLGVKDLLPLWEQVLAPDTLGEVLALGPLPEDAFRFPHELWARVVYDFALGYHFRVLYREHLLRSLVPLYLGRTAAFIRETARAGARETEAWLERSGHAFERQKRYLAERWQ